MGRKSIHRVSRLHPHKRFANVITLLNYRRGPDDNIWGANFLIDGKWTPKDGVSLGTRDFDEAAERARDKYALLTSGAPIAKPRAAKPKVPEHAFRIYAEPAIAKLKAQADQADAKVRGKGHNFRSLAGRIENDLLPRWGDMAIDQITEHGLNEWVREHRVEDRAATVAKYGRQQRSEMRQVIYKTPSISTLGNLDWAFSLVWDEAVLNGWWIGAIARSLTNRWAPTARYAPSLTMPACGPVCASCQMAGSRPRIAMIPTSSDCSLLCGADLGFRYPLGPGGQAYPLGRYPVC